MIICCGEALIDFIPTPDGKAYRPCSGGSILNIAVGLGRLEIPVGFLSRLSTDIFGDQLAAYLQKDHVDLKYCPQVDGQTTLAFVSLREPSDQEPQYAFYAEGAVDRNLVIRDLPANLDDSVLALHFGSISLVLEPGASAFEALMKRESRQRILTLDPNVRPALIQDQDTFRQRFNNWVSYVDILRLSHVDFDYLFPDRKIEDVLPGWFNAGLSMVVLTLGEEGARGYLPNGTIGSTKAPKVNVKDTVGAGDSFFSAVMAYLYEHGKLADRKSLQELTSDELNACLAYGAKAAAITCTREGSDPPYKNEMS